MLRSLLVVIVLCLLNGGDRSAAQDRPDADAEAQKLVKQLGGRAFAEREAAAKELRALGFKAFPAVSAGTRDADAEVARRCEGLLKQIWADQREAFVAHKADWPGPGWTRFREVVGDSEAGRKLFAELADDPRRAGLADRAAADPAGAAKLYAAEVARIQDAGTKAFAAFVGQPVNRAGGGRMREANRNAVPPGDVALALFLGSFPLPDGAADPGKVEYVVRASIIDLVAGPMKGPARKLYAAWLDRRRDPLALKAGLDAALFGSIPEALPVARRIAGDKKTVGAVAGAALTILGNHGGPEDLSRLAARRDDASAHWVYRVGGDKKYELQVREVAAAMSLALSGEGFEKYGFRKTSVVAWWVGPDPAPYKELTWAETPEARNAALKKAWDWLDKQPKAAPKKDTKPGK